MQVCVSLEYKRKLKGENRRYCRILMIGKDCEKTSYMDTLMSASVVLSVCVCFSSSTVQEASQGQKEGKRIKSYKKV